ncbi:hypothetical protein LOTGIDRAFT_239573 [Lottia gigantea]|uniref:Ig-like domain-containing protein n=1 Tax=Lottia gigantea TaxID=225164 RepID=V4A7G0_LOTGI|nr:hypothetical protein LOTGIDRAFT_239573 [Lottia gigantea]ESO92687.1 hypothetical protein LOTGIDRAFT_239573 [Lottia gigantea]
MVFCMNYAYTIITVIYTVVTLPNVCGEIGVNCGSGAVVGQPYNLQCTNIPDTLTNGVNVFLGDTSNSIIFCLPTSPKDCDSRNSLLYSVQSPHNKSLYFTILNVTTDDIEPSPTTTGPSPTTTRNRLPPYEEEFAPVDNCHWSPERASIYLFWMHQLQPSSQYTLRGVPESYAVLGENYTLQCDVTDSPSLVEFRRNNVAVCNMINCGSSSTDNRYKCRCINNNNKQLYLNISNINKQDDTTWSCRGNSGGQGSTTVSVYYGPQNTRFNPTNGNIDVIEGKSQSVNCLADCKPDCNINWSKDGSTTILNNPLSLSTRDQTGSYNCTVTHTVLNKQLTKHLIVQIYYGPDRLTFLPDVTSINIIEGRDQTITCLTDCYKCNYKWTGPVSSSSKDLVLTEIKRNQEGNYRCEATNIKNTISKTRSKSIQVNVHCSPRINGDLKDVVISRTGEEVTLIIDVIAYPKPSFKWIQESTGQELTPDTTQQEATNNYISSLTFTIQQSSFDNYIVTVNNSIGDDKSYTIKIIDGASGDKTLNLQQVDTTPSTPVAKEMETKTCCNNRQDRLFDLNARVQELTIKKLLLEIEILEIKKQKLLKNEC